MAEINRIKSFKTFSEVRANEAAAKLAEENANKRSELTAKIAAILDDMNITSFENLEEDVRKELITRAFGEISEEAEEDLPEVSEDEVEEIQEEESEEPIEESEEAEYVSEAIVVTGKRDANKVKKAYEGFFQSYPALGRKAAGVPKIHHIGAIKRLYAVAMEDANFSREIPATVNQMKGKLFTVDVKVADLNNAIVKVSTAKLGTLIDMHANAISGAAKWSGLAIVEGTALYLDSIGETKQAENLMAAFNRTFEGSEVNLSEEDINERNAFLAARAKAIEEDAEEFEFNGKKYPVILNEELITEGEREEQWAMEIYTDVVGPDGEFSEDELSKAGRDTFEEIVKDAGYKGSRGKKLTDILVRIATESVDTADVTEVLCEARHSEIHKAAKKGSYPVTIVITNKGGSFDGKVAHQETVDTPAAVPAAMKVLYKKYATWGHTFAIEDSTGKILFQESVEVNEAEVKSDEEFKEYAFSVLQKAFGDDFEEAKAQEVVDGILSKCGNDYGACIGMLTSSLGESVEVTEANADGTISDDEDERREKLEAQTEADFDQFLKDLRANAEDIGGPFRSPGIMADNVKVMKQVLKKNKIRF